MTIQTLNGPLIPFKISKETLEVTILPAARTLAAKMVETGIPFIDMRDHSALVRALQAHDAKRKEERDSAIKNAH